MVNILNCHDLKNVYESAHFDIYKRFYYNFLICIVRNILLCFISKEFYDRLRSTDERFEEPFVFFRQAVEHLSRAARVFRQQGGHMLLVGLGGTGKRNVIKLASYLENCEFLTLRTMSNYNTTEFHEDVKSALFSAGLDGLNTVLFLSDRCLIKVG